MDIRTAVSSFCRRFRGRPLNGGALQSRRPQLTAATPPAPPRWLFHACVGSPPVRDNAQASQITNGPVCRDKTKSKSQAREEGLAFRRLLNVQIITILPSGKCFPILAVVSCMKGSKRFPIYLVVMCCKGGVNIFHILAVGRCMGGVKFPYFSSCMLHERRKYFPYSSRRMLHTRRTFQ